MNTLRAVAVPVVAAVLLFAAAIAFASSWIDEANTDSTCGSVWHTDLWADDDDCRTTMVARAGVSAVMAGTGVALAVAAAFGRRGRALSVVSVVSVLLVAVMLIINERVRSGGGWLVG